MSVSIKEGQGEFLLRVCGVLMNQGRILLHKTKNGSGWVLPGGRAEINEETSHTVVREFREELNLEVNTQRLLWIIENFNAYEVEYLHEYGMYYLVECADELAASDEEFVGNEEEVKLVFKWFDVHELDDMTIYPNALKGLVQDIGTKAGIKHIINHDLG
ncbi:NUDIX hydrolase [Paenibacillus sp. 1001270B_150601_E10]|uniref:NUDIX hydrolase n=1 Tax=Paenibacillus sp. 1001270B_150601_E10 TaxID=2787079 RepID=UPI00189F6B11|nr:NUDIX domain-containing protein [Paenibacillus sp. 1001270B_150601_E10]